MAVGKDTLVKQAERSVQGARSMNKRPSTKMISLSTWEPKFQMFSFFKMNSDSASARLNKKNYFIKCFKPRLNACNTVNVHVSPLRHRVTLRPNSCPNVDTEELSNEMYLFM